MIIGSAFTTHRPITSEAGSAAAPATGTIVPSHDMRRSGLGAASERLHANVADLDVVFEARAKADVVFCPVCPVAHEL